MDDQMSALLISGIALATSVVSAICAVWALTQKRRYLPKPLMKRSARRISWGTEYNAETDDFGRFDELLHLEVVNKGDGIAHDVKLVLHGPTGPTTEQTHQDQLLPGKVMFVRVYVSDAPVHENSYGDTSVSTAGADPRAFSAVLTWRQAPSMWLVRKRRIREKRVTETPAISGLRN